MTAPERIYIDRGPRGGWMHRHERVPDTQHEYILTSSVSDMIRQAVEAEREAISSIIEARRGSARAWMAEMPADDPERPLFDGAAKECFAIYAAIRARKGE